MGLIPWPRRWQGRCCRPFGGSPPPPPDEAPGPGPHQPPPQSHLDPCLPVSPGPKSDSPRAPPLRLRLPSETCRSGGAGRRVQGLHRAALLPSQPPRPSRRPPADPRCSAPTLRPAPWRLWISLGRRACSAGLHTDTAFRAPGQRALPAPPAGPGVLPSRLGAARRAPGGNRNYPRTPHPPRSGCTAPSATCAERTPPRAWAPLPPAPERASVPPPRALAAAASSPPRPCRRPPAPAPASPACLPSVRRNTTNLKKKNFFFFFPEMCTKKTREIRPSEGQDTEIRTGPERPYLAQRIIYRTGEGVRIRELFLKDRVMNSCT